MRSRSYMGLHRTLLKALFPTMGILYTEDWNDLAEMHIPFMFDQVIVADSAAADRGRANWTANWSSSSHTDIKNLGEELRRRADDDGNQESKPAWAAPFVGLDVVEGWWQPIRDALLAYLRLPSDLETVSAQTSSKKKHKSKRGPVLTYVSTELEPAGAGPRLNSDDHIALVQGLRRLLGEGVLAEAHVVRGNGTMEVWEDRMRGIARSHIVLGAFGPHLADSLFMKAPTVTAPSPSSDPNVPPQTPEPLAPVLMEFFPDGMFRRDQEYAARAIGLRYIAWWNKKKFTGNSIPPVMGLPTARDAVIEDLRISIDTNEVLKTIREESLRFKNSP